MALRYQPVTETVTPPISPARAHAVDRQMDPDTPSPIQKSGRSRGRGTWRAPQKTAPGVGTRSKTRQAELEKAETTLAQASHAEWPPRPDPTMEIQHMTRELRLRDIPMDAHSRSEPEPSPASSGWNSDTTPGRFLHPSPSRCWWRAGGLNPSEYGNAGAHPSARPISRGAAARGPRLTSNTSSVQHDAFNTHWHVGPTGIPPTMGRSHASAG